MLNPPLDNEMEVSIFGGGYGESILVHPGNNEWIVIDSFRSPYTKIPVTLEYLEKININAKKAVKLIVATHWHDDHISGLSDIFNVCENALFAVSPAINSKEFLTFLYADTDLEEKRYGNNELGKILDICAKRRIDVTLAIENRKILQGASYEVYSLSPSDHSTLLAIKEIASLLPEKLKLRPGIPKPKENHSSIVLLIIANGKGILLGSDIEEVSDQRRGWTRIINSSAKPNIKSDVFKVSHHGSNTSHHNEIWVHLLDDEPLAILTSFIHGKHSLPTENDIRRIISKTTKAWITSNPMKIRKANKRDRTTEKTIKESVKAIRALSDNGQIMIRKSESDEDYKITLFGSALQLQACLS